MTAGPAPVPEAKNVKVTVVCILACNGPAHIDPQLVHLAKEVQKKRPDFTCFKLKCMSCDSLSVNMPASFKLVDQQQATVIIKKPADKNNNVVLEVQPPL